MDNDKGYTIFIKLKTELARYQYIYLLLDKSYTYNTEFSKLHCLLDKISRIRKIKSKTYQDKKIKLQNAGDTTSGHEYA